MSSLDNMSVHSYGAREAASAEMIREGFNEGDKRQVSREGLQHLDGKEERYESAIGEGGK